jgi:hypothetical protein
LPPDIASIATEQPLDAGPPDEETGPIQAKLPQTKAGVTPGLGRSTQKLEMPPQKRLRAFQALSNVLAEAA